jgi:hypothetical protein
MEESGVDWSILIFSLVAAQAHADGFEAVPVLELHGDMFV